MCKRRRRHPSMPRWTTRRSRRTRDVESTTWAQSEPAPHTSGPDVSLHANGGQRCFAGLAIEQIDDERQHDRTPLFDRSQSIRSWFQAGFVATGKWFRRAAGRARARRSQTGQLQQSGSRRGARPTRIAADWRYSRLDARQRLPVVGRMIFFGVRLSDLLASKGRAHQRPRFEECRIMFRKTIVALIAVAGRQPVCAKEASAWRGGGVWRFPWRRLAWRRLAVDGEAAVGVVPVGARLGTCAWE